MKKLFFICFVGVLIALGSCQPEIPEMKEPNIVVMCIIDNPDDFVVYIDETYKLYDTEKVQIKRFEDGSDIKLVNEQGEVISGTASYLNRGNFKVTNKRPIKVGEKIKLVVENAKYGTVESSFLAMPEKPLIKKIEVDTKKAILKVTIDNEQPNSFYAYHYEFYKNKVLLPVSQKGVLSAKEKGDFLFNNIFLAPASYLRLPQENGTWKPNDADFFDIKVSRVTKEIYEFYNQFSPINEGLESGFAEYTGVEGLNMSKGDGFFGVTNSVKINY